MALSTLHDLIGDPREFTTFTTREAAQILKCAEWTIRQMVKDGRLRPVKGMRGRFRFRRDDIEALLERR